MVGGPGRRKLIGDAVVPLVITVLLSLGAVYGLNRYFGTGGRICLDDGECKTMRISVSDTRPWTAADDEVLRSWSLKRLDARMIAIQMNRTSDAVRSRASRLNIRVRQASPQRQMG
jgi:hypothetical protein